MTIRISDYSNYSGGGFIRFTAADSSVAVSGWSFVDSSKNLLVFYDSSRLTQPIAINQQSIVYIACADTGRFTLSAILTDRTGAKGLKNIPVRVVPRQPAVPILTISVIDSSQGQLILKVDASLSFEPLARLVKYIISVNGVPNARYTPVQTIAHYSGKHTIGLQVVDDLGNVSDLVTKQYTVN